MIQFDLPKEQSSIIKVIGVGGGGGNAVNHMFGQKIEGVDFIICNTDSQALAHSKIPNRIQLGPHLTQGLGAGANPEIGRQATEESLEEIKKILEVNTKMAFITAGMGGGTGTGGAPIIAKICKDLGILTVGIVSTPFAYEGRKRQQQAEEGINTLKSYVDTLLVISNDKLRHQFGNLRMSEAFAKADNVLSTAAKCITDVINSTGQVNVDFADVCTVMKSGGVAILGSAAEAGENRAAKAIEEALNSPLLNDNDIKGAKWILINICSAQGEFEHTMDEVEVIQHYLLDRAGVGTDVILGFGYDDDLGDKLGITIIATGFQHNQSFTIPKEEIKEPVVEKIVMVLGDEKPKPQPVLVVEEKKLADPMAPQLVEEYITHQIPMPTAEEFVMPEFEKQTEAEPVMFELFPTITPQEKAAPADEFLKENIFLSFPVAQQKVDIVPLVTQAVSASKLSVVKDEEYPVAHFGKTFLSKPSNIYAEQEQPKVVAHVSRPIEQPQPKPQVQVQQEEELQMNLVEKSEPAAPIKVTPEPVLQDVDFATSPLDIEEEQRRRAEERLRKLRNLTFDVNTDDPNNEYETVPAYIRKNMEIYGTPKTIEDYYSKYLVKTDENNNATISTKNVFLDGNKPD